MNFYKEYKNASFKGKVESYSENSMPCGNNKKCIFPFSEIANREIKIRHISDESIARCNKNIIGYLEDNKRERQETIEGKYNDETIKVKSLRK